MVRKHSAFIGILCSVVSVVGGASIAYADTPLTHADIQQIRNQVDFIPGGGSLRQAKLSDRLDPGDALSTHQSAFAELEFNDGSLARVGELVLFRFQPDTRTFELDNGTLLLLIPPGQGTSRLRTPNASAGIRGSAFFSRYIEGETPDQSITLLGALTTSGITVANTTEELAWDSEEDSFTSEQSVDTTMVELEAGHMAVIVGEQPPQVFSFDMDVFYQTSALTSGLDLDGDGDSTVAIWQDDLNNDVHFLAEPVSSGDSEDDAIALVREETTEGLFAQSGTLTTPYIDNPPFVYGGNWQPNTAWVPTSPHDGPNHTEAIDDIINSGDIQAPNSHLGTGSPVSREPIPSAAPPAIVGPQPISGPRPDRAIDVPQPHVGPAPGIVGPAPGRGVNVPPTRVNTPQPSPIPDGSPNIPDPTPTPTLPDGPVLENPVIPRPNPTPIPDPVGTPSQPNPDPIPTPNPEPILEIPTIDPTPEPNRAADPGNIPGPGMGPIEDNPSAPTNETPGSNNPDPSPQPTFEPPQGNEDPADVEVDSGDDAPILSIVEENGVIVGPQ